MRPTVIALLLLSTSIVACDRGEPGRVEQRAEPVDLLVSTPAAATAATTVPATVASTERADLATRISGGIERFFVDVGSRVAAGDTLVTLDTTEINARIARAEAEARLARQTYRRIAALAADGAATAQELDDAQARLEAAEAAVRDARAQRRYVVLVAPFGGVITDRRADPGDLAVPGSPLLTLLGTSSVKIEADVPARLASDLAPGDSVEIEVPETGAVMAGRISRVVPALERASRRFRIEALPSPATSADTAASLLPGAFVRLELRRAAAATRWIPSDAVVRHGQLTGVFVVEGDRVRLRWVRLGRVRGAAVELLAGPSPEASIVRDPDPSLTDEDAVASVRRVDWRPPVAAGAAASAEGAS